MSFELTFLGSSGGPIEGGTCSLLIKPANITYSEILQLEVSPVIAIDAGSGLLSLAHVIADADAVTRRHLLIHANSLLPSDYSALPLTDPFRLLSKSTVAEGFAALTKILGRVRNIFVTHPHLDHISAFVLNLPLYACPHTVLPALHGSKFTVDALRKHVFNGVVWPDLEESGIVAFHPISTNTEVLTGEFSVSMLELSHGSHGGSVYPSLVFVVRHNDTGSLIAVFGDFESDLVLGTGLNLRVWRYLSSLVENGSLKAIVIECLTSTPKEGVELYGHLIPPHLIAELEVLAGLCPSLPLLEGLDVIITHVKDNPDGDDPHVRIMREVEELRQERKLNFRLSMALNGMLVVV